MVAVAGRDRAGAERAAAELAARLRHAVEAFPDAATLAGAVDLLVVAAPVAGHRAGLDAALAAGVPCLCEKPLVAAADRDAGLACIAAFRARGVPLFENCQWPFVLPAFFALHPQLQGQRVQKVAMGLSPAWPGRTMIEDSLSHVLSLVQGLCDLPPDCLPVAVHQTDASPLAAANDVTFRLPLPEGEIEVELQLRLCPQQPRPAWFAVNGCRVDRQLGADYAITFAARGRIVPARDPLHVLVEHCVAAVRSPRPADDARAVAIATRLQIYAEVLAQLASR